MDEKNKQKDKRTFSRILWNFIILHKLHEKAGLIGWDTAFIKDISVKGCYFSSSRIYEKGQVLDIQIFLPILKNPLFLTGEVKRCESHKQLSIYGVAVEFMELNAEQKDILIQTIDFFQRKKEEKNK